MKDFRTLKVWEKSHHLAKKIYHVTKTFPSEERFGLTNQIRRASVPVPTNIAEGCGYDTDAEFRRYLKIAMGSASEVEYQLLLSNELGFLPDNNYKPLASDIIEIKRMLASLIKRLKSN